MIALRSSSQGFIRRPASTFVGTAKRPSQPTSRLRSICIKYVLMHRTLAFALLFVIVTVPSFAQHLPGNFDLRSLDRNTPVPLARIHSTVDLDGLSFEPAWDGVDPFPVTTYAPTFGLEPSERTEIRAAYDDDHLYFSIRAYDSEPDRIRGNILGRDKLGSDDYFEVLLDTFNDNENGVIFTTSPAGIRRDTEVLNDATGTGALNADWNTHWDVAVEVTDEGWFAEMRIPFTSLRFRDTNGRVEMGIIAFRVIARKDEWDIFPAVEPNDRFARLKPSRGQTIVLDGVYSRMPIYVTPYGVAGLTRRADAEPEGGAYGFSSGREADVGGDVKIGLTNELTLDLTVNTDFAQVEADDEQVNLTRFSLFFPEKRQFFQERSGTFDFRVGGSGRVFHSRRIGLTDAGRPVQILGGARLVGRLGGWDLGVLNMQTADSETLPSENFGVVRLKRRAFNPYSYVGSVLTSRVGVDGAYNLVYGVDGVVRLRGDDYVTVQWAQTFENAQAAAGIQSGRLAAQFERRNREGFNYATSLIWAGNDFNPAVGFVRRVNFTQVQQLFALGWLPGESSALNFHGFEVQGNVFLRNIDRTVETLEAGPSWSFVKKSGGSGQLGFQVIYEDLLTPFSLSDDADVPAGSYRFVQGGASYRMSRNRLFRVGGEVNVGSFFDGRQVSVGVNPLWNVSPHLQLDGGYTYHRVRFPDRDQEFDSHLTHMRVSTALNNRVSAVAFVQFNSTRNTFTTNARFRYNFREGNDLWIVYNEGVNTHRRRSAPVLPFSDNRAVLLKYTHTFQAGM